jgi:hypothetical protein
MAGRPEKELDPTEPVQAFAQQLRDLRQCCGRPTYTTMASRTHYAAATLSEAARGVTLPTWEVTAAYVEACGGDLQEWRTRWEQTKETVTGPVDTTIAQAPRRRRYWQSAAAVLLVVAVGVLALVVTDLERSAAPARPSATVLEPLDGARVSDTPQLTVRGTVRDLPADQRLWCLVANDDDRWYPYRVRVINGDRWEATVGIGPERLQLEIEFVVHVMATSPEATNGLENVVKNAAPEWPGLDDPPVGATSLTSISVIRSR